MPPPPRGLSMPGTAEVLFLAMAAGLVLVLLVRGVQERRRTGDMTLIALVVGGALATVLEPIVDVNGHMYLPEKGAFEAFTLYDRGMPVFAVVAYAGYFAAVTYVAITAFERGITTRGLYKLFGGLVLFNVAFETPAVLLDVYSYYGDQPFDFWGFPLWWGIVNPLTGLIAASVIVLARRHGSGMWRPWLAVPLVFVAAGASNGAAASPMWLTLNSDAPKVIDYLAALVTFAIAASIVRFIGVLLVIPARPAARSGRREEHADVLDPASDEPAMTGAHA